MELSIGNDTTMENEEIGPPRPILAAKTGPPCQFRSPLWKRIF